MLESQGREERHGKTAPRSIAAEDMALFSFSAVSGSESDALPLSLIRNIVWIDPQGQPLNDVLIEYHLCKDIEAHVNLLEELAYEKVLS